MCPMLAGEVGAAAEVLPKRSPVEQSIPSYIEIIDSCVKL